jgi:hypothetical protein
MFKNNWLDKANQIYFLEEKKIQDVMSIHYPKNLITKKKYL